MIRVLGEPAIDGRGPLRSKAQRVLITALALDRGRVVSTERLVDLIWGTDQPENPTASLQNHVSRLRKILPAEASVVPVGAGYRLATPVGALDIALFEALYSAIPATPVGERLRTIDDAIALWRGAPFRELDDPHATAAELRLGETLIALQDLRAEELVTLDRIPEALAELEGTRAIDPFRETTIHMLMIARSIAGDQTRALAVYSEYRQSLIEEFGLEPSDRLRELETAIILGEHAAPARPREAGDPVSTPTPLPLPASSFLGRAKEVGEVGAALESSRILTVVGPGGVGKTRLALEALRLIDAAQGAVFIELAPLRDPTQVAEFVANALKLSPQVDVSWTDRVIETAASRPLLLVLDNCEHLIDAVARFADAVIRSAPRLRILATSREPLNIDAERLLRLDPLSTDHEAVELFMERATMSAIGLSFDVDTKETAAQICRELDGLPLAIELAAARASTMTIDQISAGLDETLGLLSRGRRTADERHRSLAALVDWSLRDLEPDLLAILLQTSVFAGSFTAADAAAVAAPTTTNIANALMDLADRSLLTTTAEPGRGQRYSFLETIRLVAREALSNQDAEDEARDRHSRWVLHQVEAAYAAFTTAAEGEMVRTVMEIHDEIRLAHQRLLRNSDAGAALLLAHCLHYPALFHAQGEMFGWIMETAERFGDVGAEHAESVLASASIGSWQAGDLDRATRFAMQAEHVGATSLTIDAGHGAMTSMADIENFAGNRQLATDLFLEATNIARRMNDPARLVTDLADYAMIAGYNGDLDEADAALSEARTLADPDSLFLAWIDYAEGEAFSESDPDRALRSLRRATRVANQQGAHFIAGVSDLTFCGLEIRHGDPHSAIPTLLSRLDFWRESGAWVQIWIAARTVVDLFVRLGEFDEAARLLTAVYASGTYDPAEGSADVGRLTAAASAIRHELGADALDNPGTGEGTPGDAVFGSLERLRILASLPR